MISAASFHASWSKLPYTNPVTTYETYSDKSNCQGKFPPVGRGGGGGVVVVSSKNTGFLNHAIPSIASALYVTNTDIFQNTCTRLQFEILKDTTFLT